MLGNGEGVGEKERRKRKLAPLPGEEEREEGTKAMKVEKTGNRRTFNLYRYVSMSFYLNNFIYYQ